MTLIQDGFANQFSYMTKNWKDVKKGFTHFAENDVGFAKITPCFENRKSTIFRGLSNGYGAGTTELYILRTIKNTILPEYLLYLVKSESFISSGKQTFSGAVGQQRVGKEFVYNYLCPLPPLPEQHRIADKISEIMSVIDNLESDKNDILSAIQLARSKILDLAIRGKLVPQDPNDEPASVLLERIRNEKEDLVKQGKIKRDNNESVIFRCGGNNYFEKLGDTVTCIDDKLPFELPDGWEWCRLELLTTLVTDYVANGSFATLKANVRTYKEKNYALFVRTVDFANNFEKDLSYIDKESYDFLDKSRLYGGELMLSNIGASIGKVFKIPYFNYPMSLAPNSIILKFYYDTTSDFFEYVFKSSIGQNYLKLLTAGTAMPKFNKTELKQMIIPLPPLPEQKRIVEKISALFEVLDNIEKNLN